MSRATRPSGAQPGTPMPASSPFVWRLASATSSVSNGPPMVVKPIADFVPWLPSFPRSKPNSVSGARWCSSLTTTSSQATTVMRLSRAIAPSPARRRSCRSGFSASGRAASAIRVSARFSMPSRASVIASCLSTTSSWTGTTGAQTLGAHLPSTPFASLIPRA